MSVIVVARMKVDPASLEGLFASRAADMEELAGKAKAAGALHHRFLAGDGEVVIVDEWGDAGAFQEFFEGQPKVQELMASAGVAGPPEVSVYRPMDSPDQF